MGELFVFAMIALLVGLPIGILANKWKGRSVLGWAIASMVFSPLFTIPALCVLPHADDIPKVR